MDWKNIFNIFKKGSNRLGNIKLQSYQDWTMTKLPFAKAVFDNCIELLTDLCNDVEWKNTGLARPSLFVDFKRFFDIYGKMIIARLFYNGFEVIGFSKTMRTDGISRLAILTPDAYTRTQDKYGNDIIVPIDKNTEVFVMQSSTYQVFHTSDYVLLHPWLEYLDNCMNASNTSASRLGNLLIMSPQNSDTLGKLSQTQREDMEDYILKNYGTLRTQKQILLLGQAMKTDVISMTGMDAQVEKKLRMAILAICDRIKVPANQVAMIDAQTSKALSNGSELLAGDFAKYQSFERLLYATFGILAEAMGLDLTYTINNKPTIQAHL